MRRQTREIPLAAFTFDPHRVHDIKGMSASIRRHGLLEPLTVMVCDADVLLLEGRRRLAAIWALVAEGGIVVDGRGGGYGDAATIYETIPCVIGYDESALGEWLLKQKAEPAVLALLAPMAN